MTRVAKVQTGGTTMSQRVLMSIATAALLDHRKKHSALVFPVLSLIARAESCDLTPTEVALCLRHFLFVGYSGDYSPFCRAAWRGFAEGNLDFELLNASEQSVLVEAFAVARYLRCAPACRIPMGPIYRTVVHGLVSKGFAINSLIRTLYGFAQGGYVSPQRPSVVLALAIRKVHYPQTNRCSW